MNDLLTVNFATDINVGHKGGKRKMNDLSVKVIRQGLQEQRDYDRYVSGKYQNNTDIQPSMLYRDFQEVRR